MNTLTTCPGCAEAFKAGYLAAVVRYCEPDDAETHDLYSDRAERAARDYFTPHESTSAAEPSREAPMSDETVIRADPTLSCPRCKALVRAVVPVMRIGNNGSGGMIDIRHEYVCGTCFRELTR